MPTTTVSPVLKFDGDFTTPQPCGGPVYSQPFPDVIEQLVFTQPWMVMNANFPSDAIGKAHPTIANYLLAEEGARQPLGAGVVKWDRTYVKKPPTRYVPELYAYPFIGFWGIWGVNTQTVVTGRDRKALPCLSRIQHDYFTILPGGVGDYISDTLIPIVYAQKYYCGSIYQLADFLADAPPFAVETTPPRHTYQTWIDDAVAHGWAATTGKIAAEDCKIDRWMGPFWVRSTRYVLAQ